MRAVSLHRDVIVVTSQVFQAHCTIVRGSADGRTAPSGGLSVITYRSGTERAAGELRLDAESEHEAGAGEETFVIDSLVLPEELELLPALVRQAGFPQPRGLLTTHADWDHMLGPLAFPAAALGCAESSVERLHAEPGAVQRQLRRFDEELHIERPRSLPLGAIQALAVPGRCELGETELELHPAAGHTVDGMVVSMPWARVLVVGDYLSPIELPQLGSHDGALVQYVATLERLRALVEEAEHVIPGHGPVLDRGRALALLGEDLGYLAELSALGSAAKLPVARSNAVNRLTHRENAMRLGAN